VIGVVGTRSTRYLSHFVPEVKRPRRGLASRRPWWAVRRRAAAYALILPVLVLVAAFALYPLVYGAVGSLEGPTGAGFVGLANYVGIFQDVAFQTAGINTVLYLTFVSAGTMAGGAAIAFWLSGRRHRAAALAVVILPWAIPGTVSSVLWLLVFNSQGGLLNSVLQALGAIRAPIVWFRTPLVAMAIISLALIWQTVPIVAVVLLAGLQSIPSELYEQCAVDGAQRKGTLRHVTLPLLRPAFAVAFVAAAATGISIFDQVYVFGGFSSSTASAVLQIDQYAFTQLNFGLAMAASVVLATATLVISLLAVRFIYREVRY
jgi:multiple sugar transport system permease protein